MDKKIYETSYEINAVSADEESLRSLKQKNYIKEYQKCKKEKYKITGNKMLPLYVEIKKKERYVDASKHRDFVFSLFSIVICFISLVEFVVAAIEAIIRDIEINIDSLEIVSLVCQVHYYFLWMYFLKKYGFGQIKKI